MATHGWDREEKFQRWVQRFRRAAVRCISYILERNLVTHQEGSAEDRAADGKVALSLQRLLVASLSQGFEGDQLEERLSRHSGASPSTDVSMET